MSKAAKKKSESQSHELTGMYELLEAVERLVHASEPALQAALARVFDDYSKDFPEEYFWATGPQAPVLLHHLMFSLTPPARTDKAKQSAKPRAK
jgi:Ni/Fe-hydrogenase subunit HybB-like protein